MLCCRLRHLILAAGCLICAQLGVQFLCAWRVEAKGADPGNTRQGRINGPFVYNYALVI